MCINQYCSLINVTPTLMSQDESAVFTTAKTLAELNTHSLWGLERPRKLIFKLF